MRIKAALKIVKEKKGSGGKVADDVVVPIEEQDSITCS